MRMQLGAAEEEVAEKSKLLERERKRMEAAVEAKARPCPPHHTTPCPPHHTTPCPLLLTTPCDATWQAVLEQAWKAEEHKRVQTAEREKLVGVATQQVSTALMATREFVTNTQQHLSVDCACLCCLRPLVEPQVRSPRDLLATSRVASRVASCGLARPPV